MNETGSQYYVSLDGSALTGGGEFRNRGTVRKSAGSGTATITAKFLQHNGAIELENVTGDGSPYLVVAPVSEVPQRGYRVREP